MATRQFNDVRLRDNRSIFFGDDEINAPSITGGSASTSIVSSAPIKFQDYSNSPSISQEGSGSNSSIVIGFPSNNVSVNSDTVRMNTLNLESLNIDVINDNEIGDLFPSDYMLVNGKNVLNSTTNGKIVIQSPNVTLTGEKYTVNINTVGITQKNNVKSARRLYISSGGFTNQIAKGDIITVEGFTGGYVVSNVSQDIPNSKIIIELFNRLQQTKIENVISSVQINNNVITINGTSLTSSLFRNGQIMKVNDRYYSFTSTNIRSDVVTGVVNASINITYLNPTIYLIAPGNGCQLKVYSNISNCIESTSDGFSLTKNGESTSLRVKKLIANNTVDTLDLTTTTYTTLLTDTLRSIKIRVNGEVYNLKLHRDNLVIL